MSRSRVILITTCQECPHKDHFGGFGQVAYVPKCRALPFGKNELPHTVTYNQRNNRAQAQPTYEIPEACPLQKL
jgi:hypothetical protein